MFEPRERAPLILLRLFFDNKNSPITSELPPLTPCNSILYL
jgi:hypothetical protein